MGDDRAQAGGLGAADDVGADGARELDPLPPERAARSASGGVGTGFGRDSGAGPPADDPSGWRLNVGVSRRLIGPRANLVVP